MMMMMMMMMMMTMIAMMMLEHVAVEQTHIGEHMSLDKD
jgi:hypothetical protein